MKRNILLVLILSSFILTSCEKEAAVAPAKAPVQTPAEVAVPAPAASISVPDGFNWANSRNVNFLINISTVRFPGIIHLINIYDGDPADGKLLGKGAVSDQMMFKCTLFLPHQVKNATIVCTAPDNTRTSQKWTITDNDIVNAKLAIQ
jgi:hypothetical protein